jgi:hypothetical protein
VVAHSTPSAGRRNGQAYRCLGRARAATLGSARSEGGCR